jgi:pimeloyl-ACP methyl ester carboxylesterase
VDDAMRMAAPAWIGHARAVSAFDYRGRCSVFTKPVLVLWGRKDVTVTEAMARETAEAFPLARLEIMEEVGHSPIVEDPAGFMRALSEFLSSVGKERA